jgi:DNA-binding SARP family transcriptional activator
VQQHAGQPAVLWHIAPFKLMSPSILLKLSAASPAACLPRHGVSSLSLRDAQLLAWLALEGPTPRLRLAALLWPDSDAEAARNSLRQRLFKLHKQIGAELVVGSGTLSLAGGVEHDLTDSDAVLGDTAADNSEFGNWLTQQRARRRARMRQSLVELAEMAEDAKDFADALTHASELLALEPLSEDAHRRVIRLHYLFGDRAAALLAFDRCEQVLKDEVGTAPSAETLALLATIGAAQTPASALLTQTVPASVLRPPRLIGREAELTALQQGWQAGQVVALIGEAGMGKTRLLQSFIDAHAGVVRAAGRPGDAGVPFATLARLLRALMTRGATLTRLQDELPAATRSEIARVLPEFDVPAARHTGEGQRLVMQRAVRALLATQTDLAGLVVDDLHFADAASLDMLGALIDEDGNPEAAALAAEPTPLRWALAYRPAEAGSPVQALHDALVEQARLAPIALAPLNEAALAALVDSLALPGVDGKALAPGLARRTGGNPLFVLETLKQAWVERTLARLADDAALPRPVSVGRLIERRIAQLSPSALALARVASIAGVDFSIGMAEQVLQASAMQFADALNELEAAQVMRGNAFAHDLVFDAVRASVPASIAAHTHAAVAALLEPMGGEPARIAQHWIDAAQPQRALPWLQQAADRARDALRLKECIEFLERKSAIEEATGDRGAAFGSLLRAADDFVNVDGTVAIALVYCERLDRLAQTPVQHIEGWLKRANFEQEITEAAQGDAARRALHASIRLGDARLIARSHLALAAALHNIDRPSDALPHFEACMPWFEAQGSDEERSELHGNLAGLYDNLGRLDDALPHHQRAIEYALACTNIANVTVALGNLACNRFDAGDLDAASGHLNRSQQLMALHDGFGANRGSQYSMLVLCSCQAGHYTEALAQAELAIGLMHQHGRNHEANAHLRHALCWRHMGQWARVQQVLELPVVREDLGATQQVHAALLRHHLAAALRQEAVTTLSDALALLPEGSRPDLRLPLLIELAGTLATGPALLQLDAVRCEAQALKHEGTVLAALVRAAGIAADVDPEAAARHAQAALALSARRQSTLLLPAELWLHCARAMLAAGDNAQARQLLATGRDWLQRTASEFVPEAFRDSFLHRNPVNRELLALASQLSR